MKTSKNIIITGGSSGLGLALAGAYAQKGNNIAIIARNADKIKSVVTSLKNKFPAVSIVGFPLDVTHSEGLSEGFSIINKTLGSIDILINSAGILKEGYFENITEKDLRDVMDVNYFGALNTIRAALPYLKSSKGKIVNISSMAGLVGVFGYTAYCGSKHALIGVSDALRAELKPYGITVQVVCPGEFDSPMVDELDKGRTPENKVHAQVIPKSSVEEIVKGVMKGVRTHTFFIYPGILTQGVALSIRMLPGISRFIGNRRIKSVYVGPNR